jgi:hypothetical protein
MPITRIYLVSLTATICLLFIFFLLNTTFDGSIWDGMQISKSALTVEYCELNRTQDLFHQSMNTYSNLVYFFLGCIVLQTALLDRKHKQADTANPLQQFPILSSLFGCCLVYLCFGSAFFHASLTWVGQRVDMNATYSLCITLLAISLYRLFHRHFISEKLKGIYIAAIILIIVIFVQVHLIIPSITLLPLLIISVITTTIINVSKNKNAYPLTLALLSFLLMGGAIILRTLDVQKIGCDPTSIYQGHSLWHIFTGMSGFLLYWFYRSELSTVIPNKMRNLETN